MKQLFDQVHMCKEHSPTAVPRKTQLIQGLSIPAEGLVTDLDLQKYYITSLYSPFVGDSNKYPTCYQ